MIYRRIFFILLFIIQFTTYSQNLDLYSFPKNIPSEYKFDPVTDYKILSKMRVKGATSTDVANYAELVSYGKKNLFESGAVYLGWSEMETYLNEVLNQELPDSLKNKHCKAYLVRSPDYNAFALHDGSFYFNIGLIADIENEAALAIIMGHEIAHYLNNDVKNSYFKKLKSFSKSNRNKTELKFENAHNSQEQEHISDSIGFILSKKAGYDITFGLNNFYHFLLDEQANKEMDKRSKKIKTVGSRSDSSSAAHDILLRTHPEGKKRIDFLKLVIKTDGLGQAWPKEFIISKSRFEKTKSSSRGEVLGLLLKSNRFVECAGRAFQYYLQEPNNDRYIYYLLESIRRKIYLNEKASSQGFLTDNYSRYFKKGEGILNDIGFLIRDSIMYDNIKVKGLLDTSDIKFNTYSEAFNYFKEIALKKNIKESILTIAMFESDKELKKEQLKKYLAFNDVKNPEFAKSYLLNKLKSEISENKNKFFLVKDVNFYEDHFYGYHVNLIKRSEASILYYSSIHEMMTKYFPDRTCSFSKEVRETNFNTFVNGEEVLSTANYFQSNSEVETSKEYSEAVFFDEDSEEKLTEAELTKEEREDEKEEEKSMFVFNPSIWNYYRANNMSSFENVEIISFDDHTAFLKTIGNTFLTVALLPLGGFYSGGSFGSNRYLFDVTYQRYDVNDKEMILSEKTVHYKMKKAYLNNSIYHILHEETKE